MAGAQCTGGVCQETPSKGAGGMGADSFQPFGHSEGFGIYSGDMEQTLDEVSHFRQSKCSVNKYLLNEWLPR